MDLSKGRSAVEDNAGTNSESKYESKIAWASEADGNVKSKIAWASEADGNVNHLKQNEEDAANLARLRNKSTIPWMSQIEASGET